MIEPEAAHEIAFRMIHAGNMRAIGRAAAYLAAIVSLVGLLAIVVLA